MLTSAPHPVSEFKTAAGRHRRGEYSEWSEPEWIQFCCTAVDILVEHSPKTDIVGVAEAIAIPGVAPADFTRYWQETAFSYAMTGMLQGVTDLAGKVASEGEQIEIIVDRKDGFCKLMNKWWQEVHGRLPTQLQPLFPQPPRFADSRDELPLQAADLLAYETAHEAQQRIRHPGRPVSKALKRLVDGRHHRASCLWYDDLREMVSAIKAGTAIHSVTGTTLYGSDTPWRAKQHWPTSGRASY